MWNLYLNTFYIISFSCSLMNIIGKITGFNMDVLSNTSPPTITKELQQTITIFDNERYSLECGIEGTPRPDYQWYVSTSWGEDTNSNIADIQFQKVPFGNQYYLEINGKKSTKKFFKLIYYCSAQNPFGILHSKKVIVEKVSRPDVIDIKYTTHNVNEGEKFVATCHIYPDLWANIYKFIQWEVRDDKSRIHKINKTEGRYSVITSTKKPQLHIRNVTKTDFAKSKFRCIFESVAHKKGDIISGYFTNIPYLDYVLPPYLSDKCYDGETISVTSGSDLELPWCSIPITFEVTWFKVDNLNNLETEIREENSKYRMISRRYGNLLIMNVTKNDAGTYKVRTTGKSKLLKIAYTIKVDETASISLSPLKVISEPSKPIEFNCSATYSKSQFHWLHNGQKVVTGYDDNNIEISISNNHSILRVKSARISATGIYQCIAAADNEFKRISEYRQLSASLLLTKVPPYLSKQFPRVEKGTNIALIQISKNSKQKTIECVFSANPRPNIDWYHDSAKIPITPLFNIEIKQDFKSVYNFIARLTINLDLINQVDIRKYAGEYQAMATNSLGEASCSTFVLMDVPLELRLPKNQTAIGGKDYLLTCYFAAMDVPQFSWDHQTESGKWESMPSNRRTKMRDNNHKLLLKDLIKAEDEGIYRCTATFNSETKIAFTYLNIANPPNLQWLPSKQEITEIYSHVCAVNTKADKPWYVWWTFTKYSNNETVIIEPNNYHSTDFEFSVKYDDSKSYTSYHDKVEGVPRIAYQYANKGVNLIVKERNSETSALGKFTCHARNHIGYTNRSVEDNFLRLEFKIIPPSTSEVIVGNDLYLNCSAKESDLNPQTRWRISNGNNYTDVNDTKKLFNNRIFQYENGTLAMKNIQETDPTKMLCFIIPSKKNFDVQSKVAYIDIRIPARTQTWPQKRFVVAGKSFNMSCIVYGHTKDLKVTWFYRSNDIGEWENIYVTCIYSLENACIHEYPSKAGRFNPISQPINATYSVAHLEFLEPMESIAGYYKCQTRNAFNKRYDETQTNLIIISKPSKVIFDSEQKPSTSTSIEIQWKPPLKDGHRPIKRYILKYSELPINLERNQIDEKTLFISNSTLFMKINNLRPFRTYNVSVAAENEVGVGEPNVMEITTQESKPEKSVRSLKASSTFPDEILVTWEPPEPYYQNGKISNYQVCYQKVDDANVAQLSWSNDNVKCEQVHANTVSVNKLPQFTNFGIRVIASNSMGHSPPAFTKVRTLEDLPQAPPTDLTCKTHQQQIQLYWNPPPFEKINGVLIGYVINYYKPNKYGDETHMNTIIVHGSDSVTLDQLEPYTGYSIHVMAMNRKGMGPPSVRIICTTAEAKPEAPEIVKAVKINNTCWQIIWLHTPKPHGKILFYCVAVGRHVDVPLCQPPDFSKRYNSMPVCDLNSAYSDVEVFARNQHDGASKKVPSFKEYSGILSIGGTINVNDGSSVLLLCETLPSYAKSTFWKKDGRVILENEYPNIKINPNNSLEIKPVEKYVNHFYTCSTESDSIEYIINVIDASDATLRPPIIADSKTTENSVFITWKSGGTTNIVAPISGFNLEWTNLYTKETKTVSLDGNSRTFYLNNVTCGSEFRIKIRSFNSEGKSPYSIVKKLRTFGIPPIIADSKAILPEKNIKSDSALLNLNAFAPGENCSALYFKIEISLTSKGIINNGEMVINKTLSIYELENKCCYRLIGLHPMTTYKFNITAYNSAGPTTTYGIFQTQGSPAGSVTTNSLTNESVLNNSSLLMIILVIVVILIMGILVIAVLYVLKQKDTRTKSNDETLNVRKLDFNQSRTDRTVAQEDTTSMDSSGEPSPYAIYQPDTDNKPNHIWTQQISQTSSTPGYNYPDHHYNQIRYDKIHQFPRSMQDSHADCIRRFNSAECLSSLGNASVSGIADLESPSNIDPNDPIIHKSIKRNSNNDDIFNNIQFAGCSTVNRPNKRVRRESENLHYAEEERMKLVNQNPNLDWRNDPTAFRNQQIYNKSINPSNRFPYKQQMSVPEPMPICVPPYGYRPTGRIRTQSGIGSSQVAIPSGASQMNNYGNYFETHTSQIGYPKRDTSNAMVCSVTEPYSKYVPKNNPPNYASHQRATAPRQEYTNTNGNVTRPARNETPDEGIYTGRVVVV